MLKIKKTIALIIFFIISSFNATAQTKTKNIHPKDSAFYYRTFYYKLIKDNNYLNWDSTKELKKCLTYYTNKKDTIWIIRSFLLYEEYEGSKGRYNNSFAYLWKALLLAKESNDIFYQHEVHTKLARLYDIYDKKKEAEFHQKKILELAKKGVEEDVMPKSCIVSAYFYFVHLYGKKKQMKKVKSYLDTCYIWANKFKYTYDQKVYLLSEKGNVLLSEGKTKEAIEILEQSKENFLRLEPKYLGIIYHNLGNAYEIDGQLLIAKDYFHKSLEYIEKYNSHYDWKGKSYERISKILEKLGKHKEAYEALNKSKEINDILYSTKSFQNQEFLSIPNLYEEEIRKKDNIIQQRNQKIAEQKAEVFRFRMLLIIAIALITVGALFKYVHYQRNKFKKDKEKQRIQSELEDKKNKALVEVKNKELTSFTLRLIDKDSLISELIRTINEYAPKNDRLKKSVSLKTTGREKLWEEFDKRFIDVNKDFYENLKEKFPNLTPTELKHCALIKLNFSAKEMAQLLNISLNGVNTSRYRIRKKIGLQREDNLVSFISSL